jgi:hypothetical protein
VVTARRHDISKVYASDAEGTDLLMIGKMDATVPNGNVAEVSFVGRFVTEKTNGGLRVKLYQAWSVSQSREEPKLWAGSKLTRTPSRTKRQYKMP